jgi:hypothetical protein
MMEPSWLGSPAEQVAAYVERIPSGCGSTSRYSFGGLVCCHYVNSWRRRAGGSIITSLDAAPRNVARLLERKRKPVAMRPASVLNLE